ncbi:MAG: Sodium/hydrogen exchanger family-domain-containing protein [Benniella sp.]|nr:MAG: Sodium/hydrogen exchanger family-domain-containing protein [Benniella sp.]
MNIYIPLEPLGNILSGEKPIRFNLANPLPLFMVQTIIILALCYTINLFMQRIRQLRVVSEVLSGIILGPSILGKIPGLNDAVFPSQSIPFLNLVANLGLVLFLFPVGLELDPKLILKRAKHALGISIAGLLVPFAFSCGVAMFLYKEFERSANGQAPPFGEFFLTCGVAMSLTVFPVLARILAANDMISCQCIRFIIEPQPSEVNHSSHGNLEMQLMSTPVGFITVCAAAAGDIIAWILLALLVSLINATNPIMPLFVILLALAWCVILVYAVRPLLMALVRLTHSEEEPSQKMIAATLVVVLTSAFVTDIIGIHSIFGGFLVGLLIPHDSGFAEGLARRMEDLVGVYFLPIFFTYSGLKTQANRMTWREALSIGFLMNCKGLVEYIILNIGHDAGVINDRIFAIMITMCIVLTIATPFVGYLYPVSYQKELEVRRDAKRERQGSHLKSSEDNGSTVATAKTCKRPNMRLPVDTQREGNRADLDSLESVRVDVSIQGVGTRTQTKCSVEQSWKSKNSILFCLDKTLNVPSVMTLLQLFSGSVQTCRPHSAHNMDNSHILERKEKHGCCSGPSDKEYRDFLQPSIDISDPNSDSHALNGRTPPPELEISVSKINTLRLLHITERTTEAMLTATRCVDRLYKDTAMVAQDILDKAKDLDVRWIIYPWNSSHLDLPATTNHQSTERHSHSGDMVSLANTPTGSTVSTPRIPAVVHDSKDDRHAGASENTLDASRQFPCNVSRHFEPEDPQRTARGWHTDFSQDDPRTTTASNTKVLSRLIPACADSNIPTAILVDRGLGVLGGVQRIALALLGGEDDFEALCLASCLAKHTPCFVTILRISPQTIPHQDSDMSAPRKSHDRQASSAHSIPQTPDPTGGSPRPESLFPDGTVPLSDETLFTKFFSSKLSLDSGSQSHHHYQKRQCELRQNGSSDGEWRDVVDDIETDMDVPKKAVIALTFHGLSDALQWTNTSLKSQDLLVMGFDSTASWSRITSTNQEESVSGTRRAEASGAGIETRLKTSDNLSSLSSLSTCQLMLGPAADKMMQSGVVSSLLIVRSRLFSQQKYNQSPKDVITIGSPSATGGNNEKRLPSSPLESK